MISLNLAKLLLFISLCLGPHFGAMDRQVQIVSGREACVWTHDSDGWTLTQLGADVDHWPENGSANVTPENFKKMGTANQQTVRLIAAHDWKTDSILYFDNGDMLEKQGHKIFYTLNAGAANQQVFAIQIRENGKLVK